MTLGHMATLTLRYKYPNVLPCYRYEAWVAWMLRGDSITTFRG